MRLGFALPQFGRLAARADRVAEVAASLERLGAHSLWVGDRLLAPARPSANYPGTDGIPVQFRSVLDPFALLTVAATATSTVQLGTNVLNLPWYPPAMLARSLTTVDLVSGGRLLPGFGIGWSPEEYRAVNIPFERRGARLDEGLDALQAIWSGGTVEHDGPLWSVPPSHVELRPARRVPIYLGGFSQAALRRIGRRADGWLPAGVVGGYLSAEALNRQREFLQRCAAEAGRGEPALPVVLRVNVPAGTALSQVVDEVGAVVVGTGIEDVFVDLMYLADDVDAALGLAAELLTELR